MLDEKDLQAIAQLMDKKLEPISARLDKLEAGQATMKQELQAEIKTSEGHMIALTEGHFNKGIGILADGHKLIMEKMVEQEDLDELREDVKTDLAILKAVVRQHAHEIKKLKKAQ